MKARPGIVIGAFMPLASTAGAQNLSQQAMCAAQAQKAFQQDKVNALNGTSMLAYEDHYNPQMDRCFMLEHETLVSNGHITVLTTLADAFEGHILASYSSDNGQQFDCELAPGHKTTLCKSAAEFDTFVEQYMGNVFGGAEH